MNIFTFSVENLPNGNYSVVVIKNGQMVIERAYADLGDVISLIPIVFLPKTEKGNFPKSGKDQKN